MFHEKGTTFLWCTDDFLTFVQHDKLIENLLSSLKEDFICADEGPADGYLGVEIKSTDWELMILGSWPIKIRYCYLSSYLVSCANIVSNK